VALGNSTLTATRPSLARISGILYAGRNPKKRTVPMTIGEPLLPGCWAQPAGGATARVARRRMKPTME
jgi:hypothetical protein